MLPIAILAGGLATRLRPVTEKIPKSLIEISGIPFIHWQLQLLKSQGIAEVVLCTGFLGERIEEFVGDGSRLGMRVRYSRDGDRLLGTGGALKKALPLLGDRFFVLYGDSYLPINYGEVLSAFLAGGREALMTVFRNEGQWDRSNVLFDQGALRIYDKQNLVPEMRHIDYGLSILSASALGGAPDETAFDLASVLTSLVREGRMTGFEVTERFYEIGSSTGIQEFTAYLERQNDVGG